MTEQLEARELFRAAYENRYTWDKQFPGYTADVTLKQDDRVYTGQVRIEPSTRTFEVLNVEDDQAKQAILGQVQEIGLHRVRYTFEQSHGQNQFSYGATDEDGSVELLVDGKAKGDRYKVRNNEVTMVHRHIHGIVVTIHTFSTHVTEAGYLAHRYDSVYHDPQTGEQKGGKSEFEDNYEQVGNYYIPSSRVICTNNNGQISTMEFSFSNIKLLQPALAQ
jgi:hypothetical protein